MQNRTETIGKTKSSTLHLKVCLEDSQTTEKGVLSKDVPCCNGRVGESAFPPKLLS
jgi:hypothetical protein